MESTKEESTQIACSPSPNEVSAELRDLPPIAADKRPSIYEYALLSQWAYQGGKVLTKGKPLPADPRWKVKKTYSGQRNYFGVLFTNTDTHHAVFAYRGTDSLGALVEDLSGIYLQQLSIQKESIFHMIRDAIEYCQEEDYTLSFTGHSLGAFLAEVSVYYCHRSHKFTAVSAVTFESPGCQESLELLQPSHPAGRLDLAQLDIMSFLSYPNLVNTCNHHVGTLYALEPVVSTTAWIADWHLKQVHSMDHIVTLLKDPAYAPAYITDWPLGNQRSYFFQYAYFQEGQYLLPAEEEAALRSGQRQFDLDYRGHYTVDAQLNAKNLMPLMHFQPELQAWLNAFYKGLWLYQQVHQVTGQALSERLLSYAKAQAIEETGLTYLLASTVITQQNGLPLFWVLTDTLSTTQVRQELSVWLRDHAAEAGQLLGFVLHDARITTEQKAEIKAQLLEEGAVLEATGRIEGGQVYGTHLELPSGASPEEVERLKDLSRHFLESVAKTGTSVKAVGIAKGAIVRGIVSNVKVALNVSQHSLATKISPMVKPTILGSIGVCVESMKR